MWAIWRATASVPPPAAHGTISVIGRSGKSAFAFPAPSRLAAASAKSAKFLTWRDTWRNIRKPSPFVFDAPGCDTATRAYALFVIRTAKRQHVKEKCRHIGATDLSEN